jgi:hypothetical protein
LVYHCCKKLNLEYTSLPYVLLGDDIVIGNKAVGELYISIVESLGVEISGVKSHKSDNFLEFAKRLLFKGQEISPFPISALRESGKKYYLLTNLLLEQESRGWRYKVSLVKSIKMFYEYVIPRPKRFRNKINIHVEIVELIMRMMRKSNTASDVINHVARHVNPSIILFTEEESVKILSEVTKVIFNECMVSFKGSKEPLGDIAFESTCRLTEDSNYISLLTAGVELHFIPLLNAYGQLEEKYLQIQKEIFDINNLDLDWPLTLRSLTFPPSDKTFIMRSKDLKSRVSAKFSHSLISYFTSNERKMLDRGTIIYLGPGPSKE